MLMNNIMIDERKPVEVTIENDGAYSVAYEGDNNTILRWKYRSAREFTMRNRAGEFSKHVNSYIYNPGERYTLNDVKRERSFKSAQEFRSAWMIDILMRTEDFGEYDMLAMAFGFYGNHYAIVPTGDGIGMREIVVVENNGDAVADKTFATSEEIVNVQTMETLKKWATMWGKPDMDPLRVYASLSQNFKDVRTGISVLVVAKEEA